MSHQVDLLAILKITSQRKGALSLQKSHLQVSNNADTKGQDEHSLLQ